jgi:LysR family glycine cleavage system transcriptional activator
MPMRLPPLNSLRAFEAAGRHGSIDRAARELHVTPAAVSHQVKALETHLGIELFRRLPRKIELTSAGAALLPKLSSGFALLGEAVDSVQRQAYPTRILVNVPPGLGSKWLMGKLPRFASVYPDIDLRIAARPTLADSARREQGDTEGLLEGGDIAIRFGHGIYPDHVVYKLFGSFALPLCSPRLLLGPRALRTPADLRYHTLLHYQHDVMLDMDRPTWSTWLKAAGVQGVDTGRGPTFNHVTLAMEAAADGMGVVLGVPIVASADLESGRLVAPFSLHLPLASAYYLVLTESAGQIPAVAAFRDWLLNEAANERWAQPDRVVDRAFDRTGTAA